MKRIHKFFTTYWLEILAVIALNLPLASNASCGPTNKKLSFTDGSVACLEEFGFLNKQGLMKSIPNESYASKSQKHISFAIAATAQPMFCPFEQSMQWGEFNSGTRWNVNPNEAKEAVRSCENKMNRAIQVLGKSADVQSCKCEVLVDSGIVKMNRSEFEQKTKLYERQIEFEYKAIRVAEDQIKLHAQNNSKIDEFKKTEALVLSQRETDEGKKLALQREDELKKTEALAIAQRQLEDLKKITVQRDEELKKLKTELAQVNRPTLNSNRRALVIGNDSYKQITKLLNAREDAKAVAESLEQIGYLVTLKLDLTEKEMKSTLRVFKSQISGGEEVVIFYAGHGVQIGSSNYLLPTDIAGENEEQIKDEAIQLQRILDDMTERKAKLTLVMLDACRDNPFKIAGRNIGGRGLAPTTAANGQMVIFSAGTGQQALDRLGPNDKDKNGVFTRVLIKEMKNTGVSVDKLIRNVRTQVVALAQSIGHEQVPAIYDQVVGDFYLTTR